MSWFKKDRDTTQIDTLLFEIDSLGRRLGGLTHMTADDSSRAIRVFKLDVIIDSVTGIKTTLLDLRNQVRSGKLETKTIRSELDEFREVFVEYQSYLDVLNDQGNEEVKFFVERPGIGSYF